MRWAALGRGRLYFVLLALPAVLYVIAWRIAPALYTIWLSFTQYNIIYDPGPRWNHLANYHRLLHDSGLFHALKLSAVFALVATGLELVIGVGAAAFLGLIVADAWEWTPLAALLLFAAMQAIPREQYEAARADGASSFQLFWRVILPQIGSMFVVAGGLRLMDAFLELDKVFVMTGGGPGTSTQLVSYYVYRQAFQNYELGYASTVITGLLALLTAVFAFYLQRYSRILRSAAS